jgi:hypothetical protein
MKAYGGVGVKHQAFLTLALDGGEWSSSHPRHFTPTENAPGIHWIRKLDGPQGWSGHSGEKKNS